jgi:RNA polymerase sigma-70 factor (ECF subfamily)
MQAGPVSHIITAPVAPNASGAVAGVVEDVELLHRAAGGDAAAFDALFRRHRSGLLGFLLRRLRRPEEAEDALSITFAKAWRARQTFRGSGGVKSWLYQIAARVALDHLRSRKRRPEAELDAEPTTALELPDDAPDPLATLLNHEHEAEIRSAISSALHRLREEERSLVQLFYYESRNYDEIGALLGVSRSQVRGRLHRLRLRLRHDLQERQRLSLA